MSPPRRILITGASGFVGRHLESAVSVAWPNTALLTPGFDLRDAAAVTQAVRAAAPDCCVHLAAVSSVDAARFDQDLAWQVNLHGSILLAQAILRHAPTCHLLFVSSSEVYGAGGEAIDESRVLAPRTLYASTKAAADLALGAMLGEGLRLTRLRPFNHTGPGQSAKFVVPAFARQIARIMSGQQTPTLQVGDLSAWRDFLDVRDVCDGYIACIACRDELPPGAIVNLASGQSRRVGDVLHEMLQLAGIKAEVRTDSSRLRGVTADRFVANPGRALALLGWKPKIPWRQTLRDVLSDWTARIAAGNDA
jgi:GDP-4-dehydro-6-deoxy-D-mannose reductase